MKIILIGFMGSGKSSVGRKLSKKLKIDFIDMDSLVVKESKRKSISEIFEKDGEVIFRKLEVKVAKKLSGIKSGVISTGGGVVLNKIILEYLKKDGVVIYLKTGFNEIKKRLKNLSDRPLFKDLNNAKKIYKQRLILYDLQSDYTIETDKLTIAQIVKEIEKLI